MPDTPLPPPALQPGHLAPPPIKPRRPQRWLWALAVLVLLLGLGWWQRAQLPQPVAGWLGAAPAEPGRPGGRGPGGRFSGPVPITAAAATRRDVPVVLDALGTVTPLATITVRAQVDGQLVEVAFIEGQEVSRGDLLARIDPRPYQASLAQALAKQAQDQALLNNARLDLARYQELSRSNGTSRQQLDTQRALVGQYEALVQADIASADAARTQLDFTTIRSPVAGRLGLRLVDQGNLVRAGDASGLVVVTQMRPITVVFTLPQQRLGAVLAAMAEGPVRVRALENDGAIRAEGSLLTIDNQVEQTTGTIKLKAVFDNADNRLWPGSFANVRIQVAVLRGVLTIPLVAVLRGPDGPFVFMPQPDNTVLQRSVTLGQLTPTDAVVTAGLEPGDVVVTSGGLRLNPGAEVMLLERPPGMPAMPPPPEGARRRQRPSQP